MANNDIFNELGQNFIEYAVAVNTDRAIPDAKSGLKPVAKRILYSAYNEGYTSNKSHVKCATIVGDVMGKWHPHGDSSIYGALVRLSQPWIMRYPLMDFHGNMGNRDGDGPAAYRYTESRLSKISEDGLLNGIKKKNVNFMPNFSETEDEPVTLPALFPNLLCNPNTGIGVAMACEWLPHNLKEVANAIYDYIDGKEPMLPGPDFPTGGIIVNKNDIPAIMKSGHGSVKVRGKYNIDGNKIIFYEIPYGVGTEDLMKEIGTACDEEKITGIENIRNESNKKGFRLVIECEKNANLSHIINLLFKETKLQVSISYNQVALVDKVPTELNLKDCIKIYLEHNIDCVVKETKFDKEKAEARLHIIEGLIKALNNIDEIIALIKGSSSTSTAKEQLIISYGFSEEQAKAILDMKLAKLSKLGFEELEEEASNLNAQITRLNEILNEPVKEIVNRLKNLVNKYGDERRTELIQVADKKSEEKEIEFVEPEKCVVIMTEGGTIKRVPVSSYRTQKRNGKGIKSQDDITQAIIRTNTIDSLMIFSDCGKVYRLLVDDIPSGTNASKGQPIKSLINMSSNENPSVIYSIYRDTDAKYVLFVTKNGVVKKTSLEEYLKTKKKDGLAAINLRDGDSLAAVALIKDEPLILITKNGMSIKFNSSEISASSRATYGVKGITLANGDQVVSALIVRDSNDKVAIFSQNGFGKKVNLNEFVSQGRGGKGAICYKPTPSTGDVISAALVSDSDNLLVAGNKSSICISATELPIMNRGPVGNMIIKGNKILSVSKV